MTTLNVQDIASQSLYGPKGFPSQLQSTEHRIAILSHATIKRGARVLEVGCGQGDSTTVLAEIVGPGGHVTAVDPGPLDYGSPFTLGQAQEHISSGRLGSRITWKQADPLAFLESDETTYDVAVLALCIWYFHDPSVLAATLSALVKRARSIFIAEWSLKASNPAAHPHILAALTQAALESQKTNPHSNIRYAATPAAIKEAATAAEWTFVSERTVVPADNILDGRWEVDLVRSAKFKMEIETFVADVRQRSAVVAMREATLAALEVVGGLKGVRSMDVWVASFTQN
ncbi:S-adenosyl-L-methionine-dependent methyltransferase [Gloeopeniophorella convolvens]|nr:S-adenosyl-L-methionine-dependent methyltransferase [Gloeopeniophorella convolvens]